MPPFRTPLLAYGGVRNGLPGSGDTAASPSLSIHRRNRHRRVLSGGGFESPWLRAASAYRKVRSPIGVIPTRPLDSHRRRPDRELHSYRGGARATGSGGVHR